MNDRAAAEEGLKRGRAAAGVSFIQPSICLAHKDEQTETSRKRKVSYFIAFIASLAIPC